MKLSELRMKESRSHHDTMEFAGCDLWLGRGSKSDLDIADVTVEFEYEAPSHTDHPYGEGSAREYHASTVDILAVRLDDDTDRRDDNGDVIGQLKAGTDLTKESWWLPEWDNWFIEKIGDKMDGEYYAHSRRRRRRRR